jgi:hypothetical protein
LSEDAQYRDFLKGQAKNAKSPFSFMDMPVKEPLDFKTHLRNDLNRDQRIVAQGDALLVPAGGGSEDRLIPDGATYFLVDLPSFSDSLDYVHMGLRRSLAFPEAKAGQVAAAQGAFAHTLGTLHLPHARLQANARHVLLAFITVEVVNLWLELFERHWPSLIHQTAYQDSSFPLDFTRKLP